jgi:hypothetical protein
VTSQNKVRLAPLSANSREFSDFRYAASFFWLEYSDASQYYATANTGGIVMRDAKDPGTLELRFRARAGRPSLFGRPLTPAERARRYRQRRADRMRMARRAPEKASDVGLLDELRGSMALGRVRNIHRIIREIAARYPL